MPRTPACSAMFDRLSKTFLVICFLFVAIYYTGGKVWDYDSDAMTATSDNLFERIFRPRVCEGKEYGFSAQDKHEKVVLVTGAAGFIGFHTSLKHKERGDFVLGLDNFNSYYDVTLKRDRAAVLAANDIMVVEGDVCDENLLRCAFAAVPFTHVVHLAAQAGVRYSIENPLAYVRSNVHCFTKLLEVVKDYEIERGESIPVIYASSSSVYGLNTKVPFSEEDVVRSPASLYAATKMADEAIAHVYHHLYNMHLTGLRFFTVYGPWGRPDMAVYKFTQSIMKGEPLTMYEPPDGQIMRRDFTFVNDIVNGIVAAVDYSAPLEIFNLGNSRPEELSTLMTLLEEGLGRDAVINKTPMIAGDVLATYANVTHAGTLLGYHPTTPLSEGIAKWIEWYRWYYNVPDADIAGVDENR